MKTENLPFLHFMVRVGSGRESGLVSPSEVKENAGPGGIFVAPLQKDRRFFPAYRFHFSIYLGNGEYLPNERRAKLFSGIAVAVRIEGRDHLLLTFEVPWPGRAWPGPWWPEEFWFRVPGVLRTQEEFLLPMFRRVARRAPVRYAGSLRHRDFQFAFAELEPTEPEILDALLDELRISLIGCDPHLKYEK
jgi:hypothetical protein